LSALARLSGLAIAGLLALPAVGHAADVSAGGQLYSVPMHTLMDLRFKNVVHQTHDLSCGAAAIATLLDYYYGDDVTEQQAIEGMMKLGDNTKINKDGFSMLELKRFGESRGYQTGGFKLNKVEDLQKLKVPVVTLIRSRGYSHFVVIKGIVDGVVYIADPAYGNRTRRLESFEPDWNHVVLVLLSNTRSGNGDFSHDSVVKAPTRQTMTIIEQTITAHSLSPGEF
jgi:uncharacterized protein